MITGAAFFQPQKGAEGAKGWTGREADDRRCFRVKSNWSIVTSIPIFSASCAILRPKNSSRPSPRTHRNARQACESDDAV